MQQHATALAAAAALFAFVFSLGPAEAQKGSGHGPGAGGSSAGHSGGRGAGPSSFSGGARSFSPSPGRGMDRSFARTAPDRGSFARQGPGPRQYGYIPSHRPPGFKGDHRRDRHVRAYRGTRFYGGYGYYNDDDLSYDNCAYYHRQALRTGSRYWWQRYNACVGRDDD